ncbi:MAG: hypothetical protein EA377_08480 [Phycisphaerales bacterium]|nr:MAG: hypothetical protein EA377_08480 [Phycisphaerales bacterium]
MSVPPFVQYETTDEYRAHYERMYCQSPVPTFDGYQVRFRKDRFEHCFYESTRRNKVKDQFSWQRAKRIDWIKAALQDPDAELYVGWDNKRKRHDHTHRVTVIVEDYVVVIRLSKRMTAQFVTAYVADSQRTIDRIRSSPRWR